MRIFSEIWNKSEILASLTIAFSAAFLLAGYEFVRSASFSLFKGAYGVDNLSLMIAFTPLSVFTVLWVYGQTLTKFGPRKTLAYSTLMSAFCICACYGLIKANYKFATILLFLIRDCYASLLVEQFWSFANSVLKESEAKRYNGLILAISTLGGICGGLLVHKYAEQWGTAQLVLIGGVLCIPCWYIAQKAYVISGYSGVEKPQESKKESIQTQSDIFGIKLFSKNRILFVIAGMILLSQFYSYFIGLNFQIAIQNQYADMDKQTAYSGLFFAITNASSVFAQFVLTPILLARFSIPALHMAIPLINLGCMGALFVFPGVGAASAAFLIYKTMEYSIFRAAKEILYIPLSFDVRFRAKELIDVLGHRSGQGIASLLFGIMQKLSLLRNVHIPFLSSGMLILWFLVLLPLIKYEKIARKQS